VAHGEGEVVYDDEMERVFCVYGMCSLLKMVYGWLILRLKVYAIAFLMTKSRINGAMRAQVSSAQLCPSIRWLMSFQEFHALATTKYLPYLQASPSTLLRAQGFLLLCFYALHMPSGEDIMTLSSWTIRFCVMSQMHLAETEPEPINGDALVHIQHRRRVFWCAYAMDRAVCSSFHIPCSIPDNQITVPVRLMQPQYLLDTR
jgi:hypothetical protein